MFFHELFFQSYNCICRPGYVGKHCEIDNDDCASGPCQHSGVCTDLVDNYSCDCQNTGFRGRNCEDNIDECAVEAPCVHGRCNDTIGDYQCLCDDTFCGKNCSRINPCLQNVSLHSHTIMILYFLFSFYLDHIVQERRHLRSSV